MTPCDSQFRGSFLATLLLFSTILQVTSTSATPLRASDPDGSPVSKSAGFDVIVRQGSPATLAVQWYPPSTSAGKYQVRITDLNTGQQRVKNIANRTLTAFVGLDLTHKFAVVVLEVDADGVTLSSSVEERWCMPITPTAAASTLTALSVQIATLDPGNFPLIFGTVRVVKGGQPLNTLPASAFTITEDGRAQARNFNITPPGVGGGVRAADIVFLIDNSGSMGDNQAQVKVQVNQFVGALVAQGIDFRLGLVKFGQGADGGNPVVVNGGALTADVATFSAWLDQMTVDGGTEPGIAAVYSGATLMAFRASVPRVFLLITDEDSDGGSLVATANVCIANNVTVHCAVDCTFGSSVADYCGPTGIAARTGGQVFPVQGPYGDILNTIGSSVATTYVFQYETDNPALDGTTRQVRLDVADGADAGSANASYRPGAAPLIVRTAATIALSGAPLTAGQAIGVGATVTDGVAPFVQGVQLHYRRVGTTIYSVKSMNTGGANLYQTTLSGADIASPGLQYYISATDGQVTTSDPSLDPAHVPYDVAVLPNVSPQITHVAPAAASVGQPLTLTADVVDVTNRVASVQVIYRRGGTLIDKAVAMTSGQSALR